MQVFQFCNMFEPCLDRDGRSGCRKLRPTKKPRSEDRGFLCVSFRQAELELEVHTCEELTSGVINRWERVTVTEWWT